jgi:hypothetical protein
LIDKSSIEVSHKELSYSTTYGVIPPQKSIS